MADGPEGLGRPGWRVSRRPGSGYSTDAAITASPPATIGTDEVDYNDKTKDMITETTVPSQLDNVKIDDHSMFDDVNTNKTPDVDNKTTGRTDEAGTAVHINPHAFEGFAG